MKTGIVNVLIFLFLLFLVPCGNAATTIDKNRKLSVLRLGLHADGIGKIDPHFAAASQDRAFADMVFSGLLRYRPGEAPNIEPDLALHIPDYTMVGGRQIWKVELRQMVFFHHRPGIKAYELTTDDVIYSLRKSANKNLSAYSGEYLDMSFEKTGRYTLNIILEKPLSPSLFLPKITNYAGGFIVSKKGIEKLGYDTYFRHPTGTGPFMFHSYDTGKKMVLMAYENYFRGRPALDSVEINFVPKTDEREKLFFENQLDVILGSGAPGWLERIRNTPGTIIDTFGVGEVATLHFNGQLPPLHDLKVRRAMAYALDRKTFLATTTQSLVGPVYSPVPVMFLPGGLNQNEVKSLGLDYEIDITKAKILLQEAGYPEGFSLTLVSSEKRLYRSLYEALSLMLSKIGITCEIKIVPHAKMHKSIRQTPQALVLYAAWRPNADAYLTHFHHSSSIVVTGKKPDTNFSHYNGIDHLIEAARFEVDPIKQITLWHQA
ncbi:MAG: hypothetical protein GY702_08360, partial [Desulfobulbaceae bacterium]|nr:hypothetical protein [Desulfobulbaceae bacterium]